MSVRGLLLSAGQLIGAVACFAYVVIERDVKWSHLPDFEAAYFNRGSGGDPVAFTEGGWFEPFRLSNPYIWLGLGVGLLIGAATLALCAHLVARRIQAQP